MRVAVFSTKPYDRTYLSAANAAHGHDLAFRDRLSGFDEQALDLARDLRTDDHVVRRHEPGEHERRRPGPDAVVGRHTREHDDDETEPDATAHETGPPGGAHRPADGPAGGKSKHTN